MTCENCQYNKPGSQLGTGICTANPPQVIVLPLRSGLQGNNIQITAHYPPIDKNTLACGLHKAKLEAVT